MDLAVDLSPRNNVRSFQSGDTSGQEQRSFRTSPWSPMQRPFQTRILGGPPVALHFKSEPLL